MQQPRLLLGGNLEAEFICPNAVLPTDRRPRLFQMFLPCSLSLRLLLRSTSAALAADTGSTDAPGSPSSTDEDEVIFYAETESDDLENLKVRELLIMLSEYTASQTPSFKIESFDTSALRLRTVYQSVNFF